MTCVSLGRFCLNNLQIVPQIPWNIFISLAMPSSSSCARSYLRYLKYDRCKKRKIMYKFLIKEKNRLNNEIAIMRKGGRSVALIHMLKWILWQKFTGFGETKLRLRKRYFINIRSYCKHEDTLYIFITMQLKHNIIITL